MRKGKVHSTGDELFEECDKRVVIKSDEDPCFNPITDQDNIFLLHSNIPREFCGNEHDKGYSDPTEEILDEDGFGTGEYKLRDDVVAFWVSAYIHSGIYLHMGTVMCAFGDSPGPGGRGWDTTPNAAFMWTDRERFESLMGADTWLKRVYDDKAGEYREAKDEKDFRDYLCRLAESELKEFQMWMSGDVYGFTTEIRTGYKKIYQDGRSVDCSEWDDGGESCWGFITEDVNDIEFPRGNGWEVFDATGAFVGDEYNIPEFVVTRKTDGGRQFLVSWPPIREPSGTSVMIRPASEAATWSSSKGDAHRFDSFGECQTVAKAVLGENAICVREMYDPNTNCAEVDAI